MEKRSCRKRSRKASEREEASEEPSPPLAKTRRRGSGAKPGEGEEKKRKGNARSKRRGLRVSFDIVENNLSVGESESTASSGPQCTLTLASRSEDAPSSAAPEPASLAGPRKPVEIKFKKPDFTVSESRVCFILKFQPRICTQFSFLVGKKRSWRSYKQLLAAERALQWRPTDPTCER